MYRWERRENKGGMQGIHTEAKLDKREAAKILKKSINNNLPLQIS